MVNYHHRLPLTRAFGSGTLSINYGAIITNVLVRDRRGQLADVVNGHINLSGYLNRSRFFGAVVSLSISGRPLSSQSS